MHAGDPGAGGRAPPPYLHDPMAPSSSGSDADAEDTDRPGVKQQQQQAVHRKRRASRNLSASSHSRASPELNGDGPDALSSSTDEGAAGDHVGDSEGEKCERSPQPPLQAPAAASSMDTTAVRRRKKRKRPTDTYEAFLQEKSRTIERHLANRDERLPSRDLETLRTFSVKRAGLVSDELRRKVWPLLVGVDPARPLVLPSQKDCERHPEFRQVVLDVNRSLKRFPPGIADEDRPELQDQLTRLIVRILIRHPDLHYYQGYHDVAITFLLVLGEDMSYRILERLSITHLQDFMAPNMEKTTMLLNYIYPIVYRSNRGLYNFLESAEIGTIFALPWLITWFGHVLPEYDDVVRLYDFFLSKPALMPVYLAAALILHREEEILSAECDLAMVHAVISRIPFNLPFEKLLVEAQALYDEYPPLSLKNEVKKRVERIERENQSHRERIKTLHNAKKKKSDPPRGNFNWSTLAVVVAVTIPVVIGYVAYRWYQSEAAKAPLYVH